MKILYKIFIYIIAIMLPCGAALADFREINSSMQYDDIPIYNDTSSIHDKSNSYSFETLNAIKDNNQKLYGIIGKSQVINFDSEITRVSLADNTIADIVVLSPTQIIINGKKTGTTSLVFWGKDEKSPVFYNLVIRQNTDAFLQAVEYIAPNENVSVIFNDTGAILSGHVSSTQTKEKIKNLAQAYNIQLTDMTESPSKQVLLEVKITEASKTFTRNLGLNIVGGRHLLLDEFSAGSWVPSEGDFTNSMTAVQSNGGLIVGFWKGGKLGIDFEASEAKGDIKILAEPKLLAVDGVEGNFSAGSEVPVPSSIGQYGYVAYDYKDTGVILKFTPTIMEKSGRIRLNLKPEVSEVDNSVTVSTSTGSTVYGFKTRKLETTVELMDGETLIIAGLLKNTSSKSKSQVPILGNIPIIGNLFSITEDDKEDDELVIFITPKIVDTSVNIDNL